MEDEGENIVERIFLKAMAKISSKLRVETSSYNGSLNLEDNWLDIKNGEVFRLWVDRGPKKSEVCLHEFERTHVIMVGSHAGW